MTPPMTPFEGLVIMLISLFCLLLVELDKKGG